MTTDVVVLADAGPVEICGRSSYRWLLDTIDALAPASVCAEGPFAMEFGGAEPPAVPGRVTLFVRTSVPLVRAHTLRAVLAAAGGDVIAGVPSGREVPWWEPPGEPDGPIAAAGRGTDAAVAFRAARPLVCAHPVESLTVAEPAELARAAYQLIAAGWVARGVVIDDPASTRIDAGVHLGPGTRILPYTSISGASVIGADCKIGPQVTIVDAEIGDGGDVRYAVCQDVEVGARANIGPYAWLRSGTRLGDGCRAGAFVEMADSVVGSGTSVPHMAGLISADVGRDCNVAGLSGPANFNGITRNRVTIGDGVSIGAGTILVAPLTIADGASTAAGSTITRDIGPGELGLSRATQENLRGWREAQEARRRVWELAHQ